MDSTPPPSQLLHDFFIFKVFADGHVQKTFYADKIPPSDDPKTGVRSRDVIISPEVSVRLFLPKLTSPGQKFPVLLYIHGGGFSIESAFSPRYHSHCSTLAAEANVICVSVEYRLAPENPVTACYDDCWAALQWIASHAENNNGREGADPWLKQHADLSKLFVAGDSAGGNITYNLLVRAGKCGLPYGVKLIGSVLVHPYLAGSGDMIDEMWMYICPDNKGVDDPRIKPDPNDLKLMPGERMLVLEAEKDEFHLRDRGFAFVDQLRKSGWSGVVDIYETPGEVHCFHLHGDMSRPVARDLVNRITTFIKKAAESSAAPSATSGGDEGDDIVFTVPAYFRIRKDGRVERLRGTETVPPGLDESTGVLSKDVVISQDNRVGARLYIPKEADLGEKLPLLLHFHGGGFCLFSAWHPLYYAYLIRLASEAKVVILSVNYRLIPEHPLPAAYDDCWAAVKWAAAHSTGDGPEPWLNEFVDYDKVFFAGESAGGNIAHQMALRAGTNPLQGIRLRGVIIDVPFFSGAEPIGKESALPKTAREKAEKICLKAIPDLKTLDHPWINPLADREKLSKMGCERVLVHVAGEDPLRDRGVAYYEALRSCGLSGRVELFESRGVGHVFQLVDPKCKQVEELLNKFVEFINA